MPRQLWPSIKDILNKDSKISPKENFSAGIKSRNYGIVVDWFVYLYVIISPTVLILISLAAWASTSQFSIVPRILGLGILLAAASTIVDWIFGLLFGIPRAFARPSPSGAQIPPAGQTPPPGQVSPQNAIINTSNISQSSGTSRVNTNLEDVSDWLTKTIIGVGLTQLYNFPSFMWKICVKFNSYGFGWEDHGELLVFCILVYFSGGGFWLGYVTTRTMLTGLLDAFDRIDVEIDRESLEKAGSPDNLRYDPTYATKFAPPPADVKKTDDLLRKIPLDKVTTITELLAWSAAQARGGNLGAARDALNDALRQHPQNELLKTNLLSTLFALGDGKQAADIVVNSKDQALESPESIMALLYQNNPEGFNRAIEIGNRLVAKEEYQDHANLYMWLAAAYGQKYKHIKRVSQNMDTKSEELKAIHTKVIENIKHALRLNPRLKGFIRSLWQPVDGSNEDDLSAIPHDDIELGYLLN